MGNFAGFIGFCAFIVAALGLCSLGAALVFGLVDLLVYLNVGQMLATVADSIAEAPRYVRYLLWIVASATATVAAGLVGIKWGGPP